MTLFAYRKTMDDGSLLSQDGRRRSESGNACLGISASHLVSMTEQS
jgi:hypothetical protein